jgi:4,5-DOPA dioxygenase extradiol
MQKNNFPSIFVSHGAPTLAIDETAAAHGFLKQLGKGIERPKAVLVISAHWEADVPTVSFAPTPETIHDFWGFPEKLYEISYPAAGATEVAASVVELLNANGIQNAISNQRGFDHGAWVPLMLMYPDADIPVTQLSLKFNSSPKEHFYIGQALKPLQKQGVLILASGGAVHNLSYFRRTQERLDWATLFDQWLNEKITEGKYQDLLDYRSLIDEGRIAHPTEEHFLPLFVAMGAGDAAQSYKGNCLHRSWTFGNLSMASYRF